MTERRWAPGEGRWRDDAPFMPRLPARRRTGVFVRREDADGFVAEMLGDEPEIEAKLRI